MPLQWWLMLWLQKMSMCKKKSLKCETFSREEKKCCWTIRSNEKKNLRIRKKKQTVGGIE